VDNLLKSSRVLTAPDDIPPELDPLLRQALAWVIRLHSGAATSDDAAALELWRRRGADHEAAFREAVRLWRSFGEATRRLVAEGHLPQAVVVEKPKEDTRLSRRALIGGALAASAAAGYLVVRPPLGLWPSLDELAADYRTGKGERRSVSLSDGVSLTLNTQTSIAVLPSTSEPHIELISGEAAVIANRRDATPLLIDASGGRITARTASFNVRCLDASVAVSCIDGSLDVSWRGRDVSLAGEQQVSYSQADGFGPALPVDAMQARAWQDGLLIVRDWPVSRLVDEVNRYRPGKILLMDSHLGQRMISGTFHLDHLDDFVAQAKSLFGANVHALPGGIVLLS
jgi:transmembrane sensor